MSPSASCPLRRRRQGAAIFLLAVLASIGGCAGQGGATLSRTPPEACATLAGTRIVASQIGKPTSGAVVQSATLVAAGAEGNVNGEYCAVKGVVMPVDPAAPGMQFQVNLPTAWNGRALQMGGGGYDGTLVTGLGSFTLQPASVANALAQGYVTLGSDGGHASSAPFDGSFGVNDEALANFGQLSVKKTHDVALSLIQARYGRTPSRFYFIGGSQGGHEALDAAARYPADYDGVIANYPAYNVTLLHLGSLNFGRILYAKGGAPWSNPAKVKLLTDAVYAACDGLDGAVDGIIGNVAGCQARFNIQTVRKTLRCAGGRDTGDNCLSDAQIDAIEALASPYSPGFPIAGMTRFEHWAILEGALYSVRSNFGAVRAPSNPLSGKEALMYAAGDQTAKYIVTRDPSLDAMHFDPKAWQARIQQLGTIMDVSDVDLGPFIAKGGKILMTHGTADDFITPWNSVAYYKALVASKGQPAVDGFMRFYLIPGMGHGFGPFAARYDGLGLLRDWVEEGRPPADVVMSDGNAGAARTRPMCVYPTWPRFTGAAGSSVDDAASFRCVASQEAS